MTPDKSQLVPFPLPEHLCIFISERLDSPIETIGDGIKAKALHVHRRMKFGRLILRAIEKTEIPIKVNQGFTMYISVSKYSRRRDANTVECRGSMLNISEEAINEITEVFEDLFRMCFVAFVDGSNFGVDYKKGQRKYAITKFLENYNLAADDLAFEKYIKYYQRLKKRGKTLTIN